MRQFLQKYFKTKLQARQKDLETEELRRSAMVFSPHYDDETLGCGGTILLKKQLGASVQIVFMADGSTSHAHLMPAPELAALRAQEALAAARALGVDETDVFLLRFPESRLRDYFEEAVDRVAAILRQHRPEQVFMPYAREPLLWSADHLATTGIVQTALRQTAPEVKMFEYPIWFWYHWPWVGVPWHRRDQALTILRNSVSSYFGLRLLHDFNYGVTIESVLAGKRAALHQHRSQITKLEPAEQWATLNEIAGGEFLECFFQPREHFALPREVSPWRDSLSLLQKRTG